MKENQVLGRSQYEVHHHQLIEISVCTTEITIEVFSFFCFVQYLIKNKNQRYWSSNFLYVNFCRCLNHSIDELIEILFSFTSFLTQKTEKKKNIDAVPQTKIKPFGFFRYDEILSGEL